METNLSFQPTQLSSIQKRNDYELFKTAEKYFESGQQLESLYALFQYLDDSVLTKFGNAERTEFTIPHGSVVVNITIKDNMVHIRAPFVTLPEKKYLPILRKCAELNFTEMTMPEIILEEGRLVFECHIPLDLAEPNKVYDILRDICINADKYDDDFVEKFGAGRIMEPMTTQHTPEVLNALLKTIQGIAAEGLRYINHFESKRLPGFACDVLFIILKRLQYSADLTGVLGNRLQQSIDAIYDRNNDNFAKLKPGKNFLTSLATLDEATLAASCYITFTLVPLRRNVNRNFLEKWIEDHFSRVQSYFNDEEFIAATLDAQYALYIILASFNTDDETRKSIEKGLKAASEKTWEQAATVLTEVLEWLYENDGSELDIEDDEEEENPAAAFDMNAYMQQINSIMGGFQNMFGNLMKGMPK